MGNTEAAADKLQRTVTDTAQYFALMPDSTFDGHQTAREVLSHFVFWHREYVRILESVAGGNEPDRKEGTFAMLNAQACRELQGCSMTELAADLQNAQRDLGRAVRSVSNPRLRLGFKQGGQKLRLGDWLLRIEAHIRNHVARFRRAQRRQAATSRQAATGAVRVVHAGD